MVGCAQSCACIDSRVSNFYSSENTDHSKRTLSGSDCRFGAAIAAATARSKDREVSVNAR